MIPTVNASLVAYYKMENATDETNNYDLSNTGVTFTQGLFLNAGNFSIAQTDRLTQATLLDSGSNAFSVATWFKMNSTKSDSSSQMNLFSKTISGGAYYFECYIQNLTHNINCLIRNGTAQPLISIGYPLTDLNEWNHLAFTGDTSNVYLYLNGFLVNQSTNYHAVHKVTTNDFTIGSRGNFNYGYFDGLIDDFKVYNTKEDIGVLYNNERRLYINARNLVNSAVINSFNVSLYYPNGVLYNTSSTNGGSINIDMTHQTLGIYDLFFTANNYSNTNTTINFINNSVSYTFYSFPTPSLNLSFYDVLNNSLLTKVYTIFDGKNNYFTNNITTGKYFSTTILSDYYRIQPIKTGYAENNFYINLSPSTVGVIKAYLVKTEDTTPITLTVQDSSLIALPDALVNVYFKNGTNLKLVATGLTNIIGKTTFELNPSYTHVFFIEAEGYDTKTFSYLPTESLTVTLSQQSSVEYTTILDTISYAYSPTLNVLTATDEQNFTFTVSDSNSQISSFSIDYDGGSDTVTGSPSGGIASLIINTSLYPNERILFYYNITTIAGETYQDSHSYFISSTEAGNTTGFFAFKNFSYTGKALSLLAVLLIAMGMLTLAKMGFGSGLITLSGTFLLVFFTWLGWVNAWLGYTTAILVLLMTIFKGGIFE